MPGHGSFSAGMPELSLTSCDDVLDPTRDSTYTFLGDFLEEMTTVFTDSLIYLGGDEVGFDPKCKWPGSRVCGYHCFDKDPSVAAWMKAQGSVFCACLLFVLRREGPHKTLGSLCCLARGSNSQSYGSSLPLIIPYSSHTVQLEQDELNAVARPLLEASHTESCPADSGARKSHSWRVDGRPVRRFPLRWATQCAVWPLY